MKPARPQGPHIPIGGSYEKKTNKIILVEGRALSACSSSFQKEKLLQINDDVSVWESLP